MHPASRLSAFFVNSKQYSFPLNVCAPPQRWQWNKLRWIREWTKRKMYDSQRLSRNERCFQWKAEFRKHVGCLRSSSLEAEPQTGVQVHIIYSRSPLRRKRIRKTGWGRVLSEARCCLSWSLLFSLIPWGALEHELHSRTIPLWGKVLAFCPPM